MKIYILGLFIALYSLSAFGEEPPAWISIRSQLDQLDEHIRTRKMRNPSIVAVNMDGTLPRQQEFIELQNMMKESWPMAVEYLDQIATNEVKKTILLFASWEIPEDDFALFLESLAEKVEQGELDWQLLKWISVPTRGSRRNFHARNEPEIQNLMTRIQELKPAD